MTIEDGQRAPCRNDDINGPVTPARTQREREIHTRGASRTAPKQFLARVALTAAMLFTVSGVAHAAPANYQLPDETAAFRPGPNLEAVQGNCVACHSADYIATQPRGPKFGRDFWQAEVTKMIKVYGAPIDEADIGKIVDYLAATY